MTTTGREFLDSDDPLVVRWRNKRAVSKAMNEAEARELIEAGRVGRLGVWSFFSAQVQESSSPVSSFDL
jgi:hypothetical protein